MGRAGGRRWEEVAGGPKIAMGACHSQQVNLSILKQTTGKIESDPLRELLTTKPKNEEIKPSVKILN